MLHKCQTWWVSGSKMTGETDEAHVHIGFHGLQLYGTLCIAHADKLNAEKLYF
jgi:hypothetical protein